MKSSRNSRHANRKGLGVLAILLAAGAARAALGQCEVDKLLASDGASSNSFGISVSVNGDLAVVGAWTDDDNGFNSGAAYIYRYDPDTSAWIEEAKLLASDGAANDQFGVSVSVSGNVVVVGSNNDEDNGIDSGSAYIYRHNGAGWIEETKLLASDGTIFDEFGFSVSISDNVVVVGAHQHEKGAIPGSAYIYRYNGAMWIEEAKLLASDGAPGDDYGISVSVSGDVVVVGARLDDDNDLNSGSVYLYRYDGSIWIEEAKLLASDGAGFGSFGIAVTICGDVMVVGAPGDDENGNWSGAVYVYRFNGATWTEEAKLLASDGAANDWYGISASLSGNMVVVGAYFDDDNGLNTGSAYVYRFDPDTSGWIEESKLLASDGDTGDFFGYSVSLSGFEAFVGAFGDDNSGISSGSAYVFDLSNLFSCPADTDCDDEVGVTDLLGLLAAWGACPAPPDACPADYDDSGTVDVFDLLALLINWGPCP